MAALQVDQPFVGGIGRGEQRQQAGQHRARTIGPGGVLLAYGGAAGGAQFVGLRIGALVLRGDARVIDQAITCRISLNAILYFKPFQ